MTRHVFLQQETKPQQVVEITATKTGGKGAMKNEQQLEAKKVEITNDVLADPVAEKLRQQRCDNRKNSRQRCT